MSGFGHVGVVLTLIVILMMINGFFATAKMAFVTLSESDIKKLRGKNTRQARALGLVLGDSTKYLSTIQVAITFAGFLSSAIAGDNSLQVSSRFFQLSPSRCQSRLQSYL